LHPAPDTAYQAQSTLPSTPHQVCRVTPKPVPFVEFQELHARHPPKPSKPAAPDERSKQTRIGQCVCCGGAGTEKERNAQHDDPKAGGAKARGNRPLAFPLFGRTLLFLLSVVVVVVVAVVSCPSLDAVLYSLALLRVGAVSRGSGIDQW
jgi:hypothetical protein